MIVGDADEAALVGVDEADELEVNDMLDDILRSSNVGRRLEQCRGLCVVFEMLELRAMSSRSAEQWQRVEMRVCNEVEKDDE